MCTIPRNDIQYTYNRLFLKYFIIFLSIFHPFFSFNGIRGPNRTLNITEYLLSYFSIPFDVRSTNACCTSRKVCFTNNSQVSKVFCFVLFYVHCSTQKNVIFKVVVICCVIKGINKLQGASFMMFKCLKVEKHFSVFNVIKGK